ncbi:MAG: ABC transporter permease subunit [Nocardioidaceae bacterium]
MTLTRTETAPELDSGAAADQAPPPTPAPRRSRRAALAKMRIWAVPGVVALWVAGWLVLKGRDTLVLGGADTTAFHRWLNGVRDAFDSARDTNWFLRSVVGGISKGLDAAMQWLQYLVSQAPAGRPVPEVGWLGVAAVLALVAYVVAGLRSALLVSVGLLAFGYLGYWSDSLDLLLVTAVAVAICAAIGLPTGIAMSRSSKVKAVVTPVLDLMQTVPAFAYLTPLVLLFGIGSASAVMVTVIYAAPPLIRVTALALDNVDAHALEASQSLGTTSWQRLRTVEMPMAKRTIIVGINQSIMAALSMATIAALIGGPGLGKPVQDALQKLDVGTAFVSGLAIVLMAIVLDRTMTAASVRQEVLTRTGDKHRNLRRGLLLAGLVGTVAAVIDSRTFLRAARFPTSPDLGSPIADWVGHASKAFVNSVGSTTSAVKNAVTYGMLNPLQSLLAESPWWLAAVALLLLAVLLGGWRAGVAALVCEGVILGTGLWNMAMVTLTTTLVATLVVMMLAAVVGVWLGRSKVADTVVRPVLDAAQTIPPFVYLVPALALFDVGRFTAIVAAVVYAAPVAVKLVADGIKGVSEETVEAAESAGTSRWQMIRKVQLPMARSSMTLAANQGLIYVLSMVVIGGLVGGGGLGFLVVQGFSQSTLFGRGLAAGIAITALGVLLDRTTKYAAARQGRG